MNQKLVTHENNRNSIQQKMKYKIQIIGAGVWGCALALNYIRAGNQIILKTKKDIDFLQIKKFFSNFCVTTYNDKFLKNNFQNENFIKISEECEKNIDFTIFAVDSKNLERALDEYLDSRSNSDVIIATKGMHHEKVQLFSSYFYDKSINPSIISGPTFANELAQGEKSSAIIASNDLNHAKDIAGKLSTNHLTLHPSDDVIGTQICGIYKNICAIAFGYLEGKNSSNNFKAKILVESTQELSFILTRFGGMQETAISYAGLGDIVLSCYSSNSRNFRYGKLIAEKGAKQASIEFTECKEGVDSTYSLAKLCRAFYKHLNILPWVYELISDE